MAAVTQDRPCVACDRFVPVAVAAVRKRTPMAFGGFTAHARGRISSIRPSSSTSRRYCATAMVAIAASQRRMELAHIPNIASSRRRPLADIELLKMHRASTSNDGPLLHLPRFRLRLPCESQTEIVASVLAYAANAAQAQDRAFTQTAYLISRL
ncbi:hypothetical protein PYCCODRAFT_916620 [Trametes coccinea BRFM310]|uniref:Uncharacterized protein n=1 Tax=Trametes coccinea (strain BRFM310) TaxID=1353009 RepID=A0A1Y2IFX8_TRAC3|nr:hypothetical protein PYCCODRAFT_916620 [Trametes coccinea BRFM310]